jgi:hypothetical protein
MVGGAVGLIAAVVVPAVTATAAPTGAVAPVPKAPAVTIVYSPSTVNVGDTVTLTVTVTNGSVPTTASYGVSFPTTAVSNLVGVPTVNVLTYSSITMPQSYGCYNSRGITPTYRTASRNCLWTFQTSEVKKFVLVAVANKSGTYVANAGAGISDPTTFQLIDRSQASTTLVVR